LSYIQDRSQRVIINHDGTKYKSSPKTIHQGVPQGSVLGPILFLIYINDLPGVLQGITGSHPISFADDTNVIISAATTSDLLTRCTLVTQQIHSWATQNFLKINVEKSQVIQFVHKNAPMQVINIPLEVQFLSQVESAKFLGLFLNSHLYWDSHIDMLLKKLNSVIYLIRSIRYTVSIDVLISLYYGLCYSHIVQTILFWGSSPQAISVFKLQNKIVRLMTNAKYDDPSLPLFRELNLLPLPCIYIFSAIVFTKNNLSSYVTNADIHNHSTRNASNLHVSFTRTKCTYNGPRNMGLIFYNKLPVHLKNNKPVSQFKSLLKNFLLGEMFFSIHEYLSFC
jgi:hypothetical protein